MNARVTIEPATTAGPHGEGHTVFSPRRQAEFLQNLQLFGNVRLAARAARCRPSTVAPMSRRWREYAISPQL